MADLRHRNRKGWYVKMNDVAMQQSAPLVIGSRRTGAFTRLDIGSKRKAQGSRRKA
jgi:hypothetical protein